MKHKSDSLHESVCSLEPLVLYKHIFSECISGESQRTSAVVMLFKRTGWALCFMIIFTVTNRVCGSYGNFTWEHKETNCGWFLCLTTHDCVCAMNSPRSFFSLENESNFLRRDFLRLRISVRKKKKPVSVV